MTITAEYVSNQEYVGKPANLLRLNTDLTREQMRPLIEGFSPLTFTPTDFESAGEVSDKGQINYFVGSKEDALRLAQRISQKSGLEIDVSKLK